MGAWAPNSSGAAKHIRQMNMGGVPAKGSVPVREYVQNEEGVYVHRPSSQAEPKAPFPSRGLRQDWTPAALIDETGCAR
jgi:hypothetical protein